MVDRLIIDTPLANPRERGKDTVYRVRDSRGQGSQREWERKTVTNYETMGETDTMRDNGVRTPSTEYGTVGARQSERMELDGEKHESNYETGEELREGGKQGSYYGTDGKKKKSDGKSKSEFMRYKKNLKLKKIEKS